MSLTVYKDFGDIGAKRISYILATKNRANYLDQTLGLLRPLVESEDELILIDGGSSDNTLEVVSRYGNTVSVFLSESDQSCPHALNKAVLLATGKYVIFLGDEDSVRPEAVPKAIEVMEYHPDIDILVCGGMKHFKTKGYSRFFYYPPGTDYGKRPEDAFKYGSCANGFVIRRRVFARVGLFPVDHLIIWDAVFIAQAIYYGAVVKFCRLLLFDHYIYQGSISYTLRDRLAADRVRAAKQYCSAAFSRRYALKYLGVERFMSAMWYRAVLGYYLGILRRKGIVAFWRKAILRERDPKRLAPSEYIWDGGFS